KEPVVPGRRRFAGIVLLRLDAAMGAVDREADAIDRGDGRFLTIRSGFRPIILDPAVTADEGNFSTIFACYVAGEHFTFVLSCQDWADSCGGRGATAECVPDVVRGDVEA